MLRNLPARSRSLLAALFGHPTEPTRRRPVRSHRRRPIGAEQLESRAILAGLSIDGGLTWDGWTNRGLSNQGGLYGSGGVTGRDTYEVYTATFAFAGNAIDGQPVKAVAPAPDGFDTGRLAWIPGGRQIQVSAGAFQAGNTILGIGVRATASDGSIAGFWPTIRFDLDSDSYQPASFEVDSAGRTTTLNNDGRTSFTTYAEPGDFTVQFEGSASWRGSSINVREAATAQLPAATVQLSGGVGSGTSYDFAFRAFAQPAAKSYQMFIDMTAIPSLYGSVYRTFFPARTGVGAIGDRVTISLNGLGSNNVVFDANLGVDLDVDSDNSNTIPDPANDSLDRSAAEEAIEEDLTRPGVIVPVGGSRAKMVVDVPHGRTATLAFDAAAAAKVKVFAASGAVALDRDQLSTTIVGGPPQTFWIEAFAPSESMADITFTLTPKGESYASADTIRATAVAASVARTVPVLYDGTPVTLSASLLGLVTVEAATLPSYGSATVTGLAVTYAGVSVDVTDSFPTMDSFMVTGTSADGSVKTVTISVVWNPFSDEMPQPNAAPPAPEPKPPFTDIQQVIDKLSKDPEAKKILDAATKAGVKIISDKTDTGGSWSPIENDGKGLIRIEPDPAKVTNLDYAAGVLLYELLRAKNHDTGVALDNQAVNGTLTAEEYADQKEMLTYDYAKEHAVLAAAAVKNGNWAAGSDLFGHTFGKGGSWETFEKFLEHEKMYPTTRPHYQIFLDRYEALRPKK